MAKHDRACFLAGQFSQLPGHDFTHATQPLDAHLMIEDADRWAPAYAEAGCGSVTFHAEAAKAPVRLAREIRSQGARASMALKPATPIEPYEALLPELDMVVAHKTEPQPGGASVSRPAYLAVVDAIIGARCSS